jgi:hypothetical protein
VAGLFINAQCHEVGQRFEESFELDFCPKEELREIEYGKPSGLGDDRKKGKAGGDSRFSTRQVEGVGLD